MICVKYYLYIHCGCDDFKEYVDTWITQIKFIFQRGVIFSVIYEWSSV